MPDMTREDCMEVFKKHDRAAWSFHNANPHAFSENSVTYAKVLLKLNEKKNRPQSPIFRYGVEGGSG